MWYCMLTDAINVLKKTLYSQRGTEDKIQNFFHYYSVSILKKS